MKFKLLFLVLVLFLIFASMTFAVDNRFFDNQTFDDATWCSGSNWVLGTCDCDEGVLDCDEGEAAYFNQAIPEASLATNVTCEAKLKQNLADDGGMYIWQFDDTNGLSRTDYTAIRHNPEQFTGESAGAEDIALTIGAPFAQLNIKETFYSNGTIALFINDTEVALLKTKPDNFNDVIYFQVQRTLSRNEDTELDDFVCYNGTFYDVSEEIIDTEPASMLLINLTSELGLGQIIFNESDEELGKLSCKARSNDTTPIFRLTTNKSATCAGGQYGFDLNYTDWKAYDTNSEASTTGGLNHIWTLVDENATNRTGPHYFSWGCKDSNNNENMTSTSGLVCVNITDPVPPQVNLKKPDDNALFFVGVNNTNIKFNGTCSDNVDGNIRYTAKGYVDYVLQLTNTTYENGTEFNFSKTVIGLGSHTWSINCTDSYNNVNSSLRSFTVEQKETITIFLDGVNESKKYEYRSIVNISANCTNKFAGTCQIELSLDADGYGFNFTSENNWINISFNLSTLRIRNWSHGPRKTTLTSVGFLNVTSNNLTIIDSVSFNVSSSGGDIQNLNISYYGQNLKFRGDLKTVYLTDNEFIHSGIYKDAVNLTHLAAGSSFIYADLTNIGNPINLTFQLSGFDLDAENEFSYVEHFNGTDGAKGFNETLTYQADAPLGYFDDFESNVSGRWVLDTTTSNCAKPTLSYSTGNDDDTLTMSASCGATACTARSGTGRLNYVDLAADFRNSSIIENNFKYSVSASCGADVDGASGGGSASIYITDGTSIVSLKSWSVSCSSSGCSNTDTNNRNFTLIKKSEDYKTWELFINGTSQGNEYFGDLDFVNKQIKFRYSVSSSAGGPCAGGACGGSGTISLHDLKWSGAWLNRSTNNGTYKPTGNITQCVTETTDDISKVTLVATEYKPSNTAIDYYVSNEGGASPTFESITSGITHTFSSTGKDLCWRATLNSSVNTSSPVVRKVEIDITPTSVENITVNLDGVDVFTFTGTLNSTTSPTFVNLTPTANQLNTIKISSATAGIIQVDNFKVNSSINPIVLNESKFEDCSNCIINFTFSGNNLRVSDLKWDFLGSWNFTAIARYGSLIINKTIQVYYSNFNVSIPSGYDWYDVFPSSFNITNVTPYTQTDSTPIWNLSNLAYDEPIDIYVKTNETSWLACLNVTYANESNRSSTSATSFVLNQTYQKILSNISIKETSIINYSYCYQETANISTDCGGLDTGSYSCEGIWDGSYPCTNTYDGDWNTYGRSASNVHAYLYINYTKPSGALDTSKWQIKDYCSERNKTMSDYADCWAQDPLQLVLYSYDAGAVSVAHWRCWDGTGDFGDIDDWTWVDADCGGVDDDSKKGYEEAMWWNLSLSIESVTHKGIWNWWDLYSCTQRFYLPWVYFSSICTDCYYDITQLDYYNIIET